jgi:hypothetical protein
MESSGNPGNFMSLLKLIANHDTALSEHMQQPAMRNCRYTSPRIQNELINIIGRDVIQKSLIAEVEKAKFFTILADEVTSHNSEQLALCFRFVDESLNIREEFIDFIALQRITGEHIAVAILEAVEQHGLEATNIVGQGYDGAANMSSSRVGVQARIKERSPWANYFHCSGHALNLVIAHSCGLVSIRNMLDKMKSVSLYFRFSPKREGLLNSIILRTMANSVRKKALLDICRTRWAERHDAYTHFYQSFVYIVRALEIISTGSAAAEDCDAIYADGWDSHSKSEAQSLLHSIACFDFIVTFMTTYHVLSHLAGITVKLQSSTLDILEAYANVCTLTSVVANL